MSDDHDIGAPRLNALLSSLRRALARQVWMHGVGTVGGVAAGWLLFAFLVDWTLHVPVAIRLLHGAVLLALPIFFLRRDLLQRLGHLPGRAGLAILVGRGHPETTDLLVSAVQLGPRAARSANRELIERVVADAEARVGGIDVSRVVDARRPRLRIGAGAAASTVTALVLLLNPTLSTIFFQRMLGADVAWPQRTHLRVEIPELSDRIQVSESAELILVRAARGTDIPVLIHVEGLVPREVIMHFESGNETPLPSGGTSLLRKTLPSVQENIEFYVTGGDDRSGLPVVHIDVLQAPDIAGLAFQVDPPAYTGRARRVVFGTDVEVLQGSRVKVNMLPDPIEANGTVRILPANLEMALTREPFPSAEGPGAEEGSAAEATDAPPGLSFELVAENSLRFQFELTDETGLSNPDPGLFGVQVIEDRRPEVVLLAPGRAEVNVVAGGAVPLRVRIEDDFGLAGVRWDVRSYTDPDRLLTEGTLASREAEPEGESAYLAGARAVAVATTRLEVDELGGETLLLEGQQVILQVVATDNRDPDPNESQSAPVRLHVVSGDEFLRRLKDNLARAGELASKLNELAEQEEVATRGALAAIDPEEPDEDASGELGGLLNRARRVQGDARALANDLAQVTESLIYARVDDRAGPLLEALDAKLERFTDRGFHTEPWRELVLRYGAGQLGQANLAGDLVALVGLALTLSEEHCVAAVEALAAGRDALGATGVRKALSEAVVAQEHARATLDQLLVKLGEWDNFQSVLTLTRDILNRQKNLNQRTRKYAEEH